MCQLPTALINLGMNITEEFNIAPKKSFYAHYIYLTVILENFYNPRLDAA
jgi:hypothetical protein